jgi:hypothetical protein
MSNVIGSFSVKWPQGFSEYVLRTYSVLDFDVDIISFGADHGLTALRCVTCAVYLQATMAGGAGCVAPTSWRWDFGLQLALPIVVAVSYFSPLWLHILQAKFGINISRSCIFRSTQPSDARSWVPMPLPVMHAMRNAAVSKTLAIINIIYLPVSRYSISVFFCTQLRDGQSVLRVFPDVSCTSSDYYIFLCLGFFGTTACTWPPHCFHAARFVQMRSRHSTVMCRAFAGGLQI